jgi:hypothetical protein
MAIRRLSSSNISTAGRGKSSSALAGYSPAIDEMDLIERVVVGSGGVASITFSNIPQTYTHLQIRMIASGARSDGNPGWWNVNVQFNGDTSLSGTLHALWGNGSSAGSDGATGRGGVGFATVNGYSSDSTTMCAAVVDILDYANSSKNTTVRSFSGADRNGAGHISLISGLWLNTNAVTSLNIVADAGITGFRRWTTASLYGVKA